MQVSHYDKETGIYIGSTVADKSPREPGVYLLPAHATFTAVPGYDLETQLCRWVDGAWQVEQIQRPAPEPNPTETEIKNSLVIAVQLHMNETVKMRGYDNIMSCVTYADEPAVPQFQTEGQKARAWRSLVWAKCYQVMADVKDGKRAIPTTEELISELPELEW